MALTLESNYKTALQGGAFQESWLFEIRNNTYTDGSVDTQYIRLGTEEVGNGDTKYNSFIINKPTIRESIDLEKGTARTGNMTITCTNGTLSNHSAKLSSEIFNGTRFYINHQVVVYSKVGSISSGDYLKIFTGRVKDIKVSDRQEVSITIASATPIDFIKIPQHQSNSGNYYPIIYGDFKDAPSSNVGSPAFIDNDTDTKLFPVEVDTINNGSYNCLFVGQQTFGTPQDSGAVVTIQVSETATQVGVTAANFAAGELIKINDERMYITSTQASGLILNVIRGYQGSPIQFHESTSNIYDIAIIGSGKLHYPVKDAFRNSDDYPIFAPIDQTETIPTNEYETKDSDGNVTADNNRFILRTPLDLEREFKYRPSIKQVNTLVVNAASQGTSTIVLDNSNKQANAVDTNTSSFFGFTHTHTATSSSAGQNANNFLEIEFEPSKDDHKILTYILSITYSVTSYSFGEGTSYEVLPKVTAVFDDGSVENENGSSQNSTVTDRVETFNFLTEYTNSDGNAPSKFILKFQFNSIGNESSSVNTMTVNLKDVSLQVKSKIEEETDSDVNPLEHSSAVNAVKKLYSGADGFEKSFSSGTVANIVDMHRDLLSRFTGRAGSSETPDTNTSNYAGLITARSSWKSEYWTTKEVQVNSLLEKCQFEGGFVFRFRTSDETPQYIYIPDTVSVDHKIDLSDISSFSLEVTPVDKLITKRIIKYQRSPINNKHLYEQTSEDTTNSVRGNYNILTNENIDTNKLDILIGGLGATDTGSGNRNDGFANYYRNINGIPKLIASVELLDPESSNVGSNYFYGMEVGDFCQFESSVSAVLPMFGGTFSGNSGSKFIVTSITRAAGSLKVTLREI